MRVLLTNHSMVHRAGSEIWVMEMAQALKRLGHDVSIWTPEEVAPLIEEEFQYKSGSGRYDLGLFNHSVTMLPEMLEICDKTVLTRHGVLPGLEKPVKGADFYVSVSEECQEVSRLAGFKSTIIRNGVDVDRFSLRESMPNSLENILILSNKSYLDWSRHIEKAFPNSNVWAIGEYYGNVFADVRPALSAADLVITLGRGCYEALACGTPVIVADQYIGSKISADGMVNTETILQFRQNNCSGRFNKKVATVEWLCEEITGHNPSVQGPALREYVEAEHNVLNAAQSYIDLTQ